MVQFRLLAWRWKIQVQEFSEQIWRSSKFGLSVILAGSLLYLYWAFHIPSPGKAVAALAVAAAIMTFRGEIGGLEKFFWMAMLFVFLFMELRAIDHDRAIYSAEQVKARREEAAAFTAIGTGLTTGFNQTLSEQKQGFETMLSQNRQDFEATMSQFGESAKMLTGGDSFCYFDTQYLSLPTKGDPGPTVVVLKKHGQYPLSGITAQSLGTVPSRPGTTLMTAQDYQIPDLPTGDKKERYGTYVLPYQLLGDSVDIDVAFRAKNGVWHQLIRLRRGPGPSPELSTWLLAIRIYWMKLGKKPDNVLIFSRVDDGFPMKGVRWDPHLMGE